MFASPNGSPSCLKKEGVREVDNFVIGHTGCFCTSSKKFSSPNDEVILESTDCHLFPHPIPFPGVQRVWILFEGLWFISGDTYVPGREGSGSCQHRQAWTWYLAFQMRCFSWGWYYTWRADLWCQAIARGSGRRKEKVRRWGQLSPRVSVNGANKLSNEIKVQNIQPSIWFHSDVDCCSEGTHRFYFDRSWSTISSTSVHSGPD